MRIKSIIYFLAFCTSSLLIACNNDTPEGEGPSGNGDIEGKDVTIYVTTSTRGEDFSRKGIDFSEKSNMAPTAITLDPSVRYQEMDGFGAAITGSTCFNLMLMQPADRTQFLKETFSDKEGMGYSYIRIAIGCSDFSLSEYTCCDTKGIENFSLQEEERDFIIPILKEIVSINPNVKIIGSPWTCPLWMKVNNLVDSQPYNSWTGGQLNPDYYQDYATYFVKWVEAFKKEGFTIHAITPQNEPLNRGNSASLYMGWEEQQEFVKTALGPKLREAGLSTKIYAYDHNYNYDNEDSQKNYPIKIYNDEIAASFIAGAAYHNYGGDRSELLEIHNKRPDKELIFTETSIGEWNQGRNLEQRLLEDMADIGLGTINNWCKAVMVWNLMLDTDLGPNRPGGCTTCYGAVDISNSDYKTIRRNSHYYVVGHLASVVKPGAVRIGTKGYNGEGITYSAFENTDGTYGVVLMNTNSQKIKITINDGNHHFAYDVPANSVVSYRWKK